MTGAYSYLAPLWLNAFLTISVLSYLGTMWLATARLRVAHAAVWNELGQPFSLRPNAIWSLLKLTQFVMLTGRHRTMNDMALTLRVYAARGLLALAVIAMLLARIYGYQVTVNE